MKVFTAKIKRFIYLIKTYSVYYRKYPIGLFLKLVYLPFQLLMYVFLWFAISKHTSIDMKYMFFYYLYAILLSYAFPFVRIARDIQADVMSGRIVNVLVRPLNYIEPILSKYIAWLLCYSVVYIPVITLTVIFYPISYLYLLQFIVLVILGSIIEFFLWYNIGLLSLRVEKIRGIMIAVSAIRQFASGTLIPLSFFPEHLQKICKLLPFRLYIFTPIHTLLHGQTNQSFLEIVLLCLLWIFLFSVNSSYLWNKGMESIKINGQ